MGATPNDSVVVNKAALQKNKTIDTQDGQTVIHNELKHKAFATDAVLPNEQASKSLRVQSTKQSSKPNGGAERSKNPTKSVEQKSSNEGHSQPNHKITGDWGDLYGGDGEEDDVESNEDEDEDAGYDDAARPGQSATQRGWL